MPNETIQRTMPRVNTLTQDLQTSAVAPILTLVLLLARRARLCTHPPQDGAAVLLEGWGKVAAQVLAGLDVNPGDLQLARRVGQRAVRIAQGYETAARDKAYQVLAEFLEGTRGLQRPLTDEECVAINNGLLHAFAGYTAFLDHTAGAVAGGL